MPQTEAKITPIDRKENERMIVVYVDDAVATTNMHTASVKLGLATNAKNGEARLEVDQVLDIRMSPTFLKQLAKSLTYEVARYESAFGTIMEVEQAVAMSKAPAGERVN